MNKEESLKLIIDAKSWQKDSFGLFDFESKDLIKSVIKIEKTSKYYKHNYNRQTAKV